MSTVALEQLGKEFEKVALAFAQSGEPVLLTKEGQPLLRITPAVALVRKAAPLPNREEWIRTLPVTDSDAILDEIRSDKV